MSKRRQSSIINNFFTLASIIIISATLVLYTKYIAPKKDKEEITLKSKIEKSQCIEDSFSKIKIINKKLLIESQKALNNGFYKLNGGIIEKNSEIKEYINQKELDSYFIKAISTSAKKDIKKYLNINYELIEGPSKQSTCKFCEANIISSFRAGHKEIFRMDTDIILLNKTEIQSRIECIIKVYKNHGN